MGRSNNKYLACHKHYESMIKLISTHVTLRIFISCSHMICLIFQCNCEFKTFILKCTKYWLFWLRHWVWAEWTRMCLNLVAKAENNESFCLSEWSKWLWLVTMKHQICGILTWPNPKQQQILLWSWSNSFVHIYRFV